MHMCFIICLMSFKFYKSIYGRHLSFLLISILFFNIHALETGILQKKKLFQNVKQPSDVAKTFSILSFAENDSAAVEIIR